MEEDDDLIATLIPVSDRTEHAFRLGPNKKRWLLPTRGRFDDEGPTISSREITPACDLSQIENDDSRDDPERWYRLLLDFVKPPEDPAKGYAFGTDRQKCDVVLGGQGTARGISKVHFHITFDVIREKRCLVLRDSSRWGTAVSYSGQAEHEVRHKFTWILNLKEVIGEEGEGEKEEGEKEEKDKEGEGEWKLKVHVGELNFKVELASHQTSKIKYEDKVTDFLKLSQTADPPLGGLTIDSYTTEAMPSQSLTPGQRPVYIYLNNLGKGSFGQVDKVVDASTGAIYARKTFYEPRWRKDEEWRRRQRVEWLDQIRREIRIMREHPHKYIVPIVDFQEDPQPFLVMPYLDPGSLEFENSRVPFTAEETIDLLFQGLTVLEHLHSRGVAYRDVKPANILVERRSPLHLQFADFGFANDQPNLKTYCGTEQYCAPEVFAGWDYTTAVDIWSLGVIVLEYIYGLPQNVQARMGGEAASRERGLAWCYRLVKYVDDWDSDCWIDFLAAWMLRIEPRERLSAGACLTKADDLGLFNDLSGGPGDATPTRTRSTTSAAMMRNEEENPSVIAGTMWNAGRENGNDDDDDDDQAGRPISNNLPMTSTSHQLGVSGSQSGTSIPRPRKDSSKALSGPLNNHIRSSLEPQSPPRARSMNTASKRHRSPVVSSSSNPSDRSRIKRRPTETRPIQDSPESIANKVTNVDADHIGMTVDGQIVLVRKQDRTINATQIVKLTHKSGKEQGSILNRLRRERKYKTWRFRNRPNIWVSIQRGKEFCVELGLEEKLRPLLYKVSDLQSHQSNMDKCRFRALVPNLQLNGSSPSQEKSLIGPKTSLQIPTHPPETSSFTYIINQCYSIMIRKSDWRINCTQVANQVSDKSAIRRLRQEISSDSYDFIRGGSRYRQGTYVDFNIGIEWCRELGLGDLADQLLHLRRIESEGAIDVQQDHLVSPALEGAVTVPVSSRLADSDHNQNRAVAGQSHSQESSDPLEDNDSLAEDDGSLEGDHASSVDTNITQLHALRSNESDKVLLRQPSDDTETNSDQRVEERTSYYSYGDFEPRNSELKEVKVVGLQAPSKTSSWYGSMMNDSRSFFLTDG